MHALTGLALQYGESPLWCASSAGETECVKVLVKYGAQVLLSVRCSQINQLADAE